MQIKHEAHPERQSVLDICVKLLHSLELEGDAGRQEFVSTLAPRGLAVHARTGYSASGIEYEEFRDGFADRIPWDAGQKLIEAIDGDATVLIDHDIAMVWTPYYFLKNGTLSHVGTNCFTLIKRDWKGEGNKEWLVVGVMDTARKPSEDDKRRHEPQR